MAEFMLIFGVVAFFAIAMLIFLTVKNLMHSLSLVMLLLFIISTAGGYFIIKDAIELKNRLAGSDNIAVLADGKEVVTGLILREEPTSLAGSQLDDARALLAGENPKGEYYKAFIVNIAVMDKISDSKIDFGGKAFDAEKAKEALKSDRPGEVLGLGSNINSDELKAALFSTVFVNHLANDPLLFFEQYKEGNVKVVPETAVFKFMKFAPVGLLKTVIGNTLEFAETKSQGLGEKKG